MSQSFTVKAINQKTTGRTFGYLCGNYVVDTKPDRLQMFQVSGCEGSVSLYADHFERLIVENPSGRTVENVVANAESPPPKDEVA